MCVLNSFLVLIAHLAFTVQVRRKYVPSALILVVLAFWFSCVRKRLLPHDCSLSLQTLTVFDRSGPEAGAPGPLRQQGPVAPGPLDQVRYLKVGLEMFSLHTFGSVFKYPSRAFQERH